MISLSYIFILLFTASLIYSVKITPLYLKYQIAFALLATSLSYFISKLISLPEIIKAQYMGIKAILKNKKTTKQTFLYTLADSHIKIYIPFFIIILTIPHPFIALLLISAGFLALLIKINALLKICKASKINHILMLYVLLAMKNISEIAAYVASIKGNLPAINPYYAAFFISIILALTDLLPLRGIGVKEISMAGILSIKYGNLKYMLFAFSLTSIIIYSLSFVISRIIFLNNKKDNV